MFFVKGVMMKLRVDAAEHGLSEDYLRRKKDCLLLMNFTVGLKVE